jgi:pilus assembly protein Flp/PilA
MLAIAATIQKLLRDQQGATVIEYGLIAGMIVIAIVGGMTGFANEANDMWDKISNELADAR